jgi:hypothetical protein
VPHSRIVTAPPGARSSNRLSTLSITSCTQLSRSPCTTTVSHEFERQRKVPVGVLGGPADSGYAEERIVAAVEVVARDRARHCEVAHLRRSMSVNDDYAKEFRLDSHTVSGLWMRLSC